MASGMVFLLSVPTLLLLVSDLADAMPTGKVVNHVPRSSCGDPSGGVVIYNLTFETFWSRDLFPKQYPMYRPPAQWSRLVGRTHGDRYSLWSEGRLATPLVKEFAETGDSNVLDTESQGHGYLFDAFSVPAILQGAGSSSSWIMADWEHSKVSAISKIVPSPDWFVGVDSVELCADGRWLDSVQLNISPMDAGTDRGFTFTAPNWPEMPPKVITAITSNSPNHPASSFLYPEKGNLPTIASIRLTKVESLADDSGSKSTLFTDDSDSSGRDAALMVLHNLLLNDDSDVEVPEDAAKVETSKNSPAKTQTAPQVRVGDRPLSAAVPAPPHLPEIGRKRTDTTESVNGLLDRTQSKKSKSVKSPSDKDSLRKRKNKKRKRQRKLKTKKHRKTRKTLPTEETKNGVVMKTAATPVECEVTDWLSWSPCSKTCGYGSRMRMRRVLVQPQHGGLPCPSLMEEEMCGSMRSCEWNHFSLTNWGSQGR